MRKATNSTAAATIGAHTHELASDAPGSSKSIAFTPNNSSSTNSVKITAPPTSSGPRESSRSLPGRSAAANGISTRQNGMHR